MSGKRLVYLRWMDAALSPEWQIPDEGTGLSEIESVGYIVYEDGEHIQIAQSSFGDYKFSAVQAIPKPCIVEKYSVGRMTRK